MANTLRLLLVLGICLVNTLDSTVLKNAPLEETTDVTSTLSFDFTQTYTSPQYINQNNIATSTQNDVTRTEGSSQSSIASSTLVDDVTSDATYLIPESIEIGIEGFVTPNPTVNISGWDVIETPVVTVPTAERQGLTTPFQYDETQSAQMVSTRKSSSYHSMESQSEANLQMVTQSAPLLQEEYFQSTVPNWVTDEETLGTNSSNLEEETHTSNKSDFETTTKGLTKKWRMHIKEEKECLEKILEELSQAMPGEVFCPRVWDEILCWPPADAGTDVFIPCKESYAFSGNGNAARYCQPNGKWAEKPGEVAENGWTDYTKCIHVPLRSALIYKWLPTIQKMSEIGYSVSLITLMVSFSILICLRRLRCPRNILHLHLFFSFMMRALVVLFKAYVLTTDEDTLSPGLTSAAPGPWWCRLVITIWQYFILANYSWILMEGLYLHNLIFSAMFTDSSSIRSHVLLGWGMPLCCVLMWSILKRSLDNRQCWTINHVQWIFWLCIRIPVAVSNFVNFFFFVNIIRELYVKMRSTISDESIKYKKLAKSTLVLVPLFGVHYFLLWGLSTSPTPKVELVWLLLDQVFSSFQGFFVAVLYCLMNGEVRLEFKKLHGRYRQESLVSAESAMVTKGFFRKRGSSVLQSENRDSRRKSSGADDKHNTKSDVHTPLARLKYTTEPNDQKQEDSALLNHRTPVNNGHKDSMV